MRYKCQSENAPPIPKPQEENVLTVLHIHTRLHEKKLSENKSLRHWRGDSNRQGNRLGIFLFNIIPLLKDPGSRTNYAALKWGGGRLWRLWRGQKVLLDQVQSVFAIPARDTALLVVISSAVQLTRLDMTAVTFRSTLTKVVLHHPFLIT